MSARKESSMGTVSLIFGILGCVGVLPCLGALIAIVTGFMGRGTTDESNANIGLILGFLGCCWQVVGIIVIIVLIVMGVLFSGVF